MVLIQNALALIVTLGILVTFHELGHYLIARWSGVHVVRFSVGFGSPIWSKFDRRGTEFAIAAIPLGGYLRMQDARDPDAVTRAGTLSVQDLSPGWRIAIALGGPVANFLFAFLVFCGVAMIGTTNTIPTIAGAEPDTAMASAGVSGPLELVAVDGEPTLSWQQVNMALAGRLGETGTIEFAVRDPGREAVRSVQVPVEDWHSGVSDPDLFGSLGIKPVLLAWVGSVVGQSAAERAGIEVGDVVLSADGVPAVIWKDWVAAVQAAPGTPIDLIVRRDGSERALSLTPDERMDDTGKPFGFAGVGPAVNMVRYGFIDALGQGVSETAGNTAMTLGLIKKMLFGQVSVKNLGGPITIATVAGQAAKSGWRYYVGILALLSISLGVLNLMPIPMLDGGHVMYCLAELVTGSPVSERVQLIGMQVGMFLVAGLMLLVFYNDIARFM